jgi:hypothetical protein
MSSPVEKFLHKRKIKKIEYTVKMVKSETVSCFDCGNKIFDGSGISACICYGEDYNRKVYIKKTEEGIKVSFPRSWDQENIQMLLETLRRKRG